MVNLGGHRQAKYTTGTRLGASLDWNCMQAERWSHSEGELGEVEVRDTEVIVMLQGRLHVRRRGDGELQYCNAVPGTIWLCPNGVREDMIHLYGDVRESLHIFLPALPLSRTVAQEIGVDSDTVQLHYHGGFRDSLIEQIAWAIHAEMTDPAPAGKMLIETLAAALGIHVVPALFQPGARFEIAAAGPRRPRSPAPSTRHRFHRSPSRGGPEHRDAGERGLPQPVPLRPRLQGRHRKSAAPLRHRPPDRAREGAARCGRASPHRGRR